MLNKAVQRAVITKVPSTRNVNLITTVIFSALMFPLGFGMAFDSPHFHLSSLEQRSPRSSETTLKDSTQRVERFPTLRITVPTSPTLSH